MARIGKGRASKTIVLSPLTNGENTKMYEIYFDCFNVFILSQNQISFSARPVRRWVTTNFHTPAGYSPSSSVFYFKHNTTGCAHSSVVANAEGAINIRV